MLIYQTNHVELAFNSPHVGYTITEDRICSRWASVAVDIFGCDAIVDSKTYLLGTQ